MATKSLSTSWDGLIFIPTIIFAIAASLFARNDASVDDGFEEFGPKTQDYDAAVVDLVKWGYLEAWMFGDGLVRMRATRKGVALGKVSDC